MAISSTLKAAILKAPQTKGNKLGRLAIERDLSVIRISKATGATRQTVYNWFVGGRVAPFYAKDVNTLIEILNDATTPDIAWRNVCKRFSLST